MGNICRSPTAHGVFRELIRQHGLEDRIEVDSAGTHAYHVGEKPDSRSQRTALERGVDLSDLHARKVDAYDFTLFDYVLAMDHDNFQILKTLCSADQCHKLKLFLAFAPQLNRDDVPDPYYGGPQGFEHVFDMISEAAHGLLHEIQQEL